MRAGVGAARHSSLEVLGEVEAEFSADDEWGGDTGPAQELQEAAGLSEGN